MADKPYNGWSNYETWAVKLWIDNEKGSYNEWREHTRAVWESSEDKSPNQFLDKRSNAVATLADLLEATYDSSSDHPVFAAANGTVYADLLNAALADVNWHEIATAMLDDMENE
jgi:hypothetical protein